jgi:hypothetical protein
MQPVRIFALAGLENAGLYLYARKIFGSLVHIHPPQANANSARRNEDYIVPIPMQLGGCLDD